MIYYFSFLGLPLLALGFSSTLRFSFSKTTSFLGRPRFFAVVIDSITVSSIFFFGRPLLVTGLDSSISSFTTFLGLPLLFGLFSLNISSLISSVFSSLILSSLSEIFIAAVVIGSVVGMAMLAVLKKKVVE